MSEGREGKAIFWLAAIAVMVGGSLRELLKSKQIELPWYIELASPVMIYEGLYFLVNKFMWKWRIFRLIGWAKVPNLSGDWKASFKSSYDQFKTIHTGTVRIKQSWTSIDVWLQTTQSESHSEMATISVEPNGDKFLIYEYV